jgi:hypothetical protein
MAETQEREPSPSPYQRSDILLRMASEQMEYARHHENLRERSTQIILIIAGALVAALEIPGALDEAQAPVSIALVILGLFGALLSWKHYEKHQEHYEQATVLQRHALGALPDRTIAKEAKNAREEVRKRFAYFRTVRLNLLWLIINLLIMVAGIYFLLSSWR